MAAVANSSPFTDPTRLVQLTSADGRVCVGVLGEEVEAAWGTAAVTWALEHLGPQLSNQPTGRSRRAVAP